MKPANNRIPRRLVRWACAMDVGLREPADRPWHAVGPPPVPVPSWEHRCPRDGAAVTLHGYVTCDHAGNICVGQCGQCEAIYWASGDRYPSTNSPVRC